MRVVDKCMVFSEELAGLFFLRLAPFLRPEPADDSDGSVGFVAARSGEESSNANNDGAACWVAAGLNPTFRICRYSVGGFFAPHQVFVKDLSASYVHSPTSYHLLPPAFCAGRQVSSWQSISESSHLHVLPQRWLRGGRLHILPPLATALRTRPPRPGLLNAFQRTAPPQLKLVGTFNVLLGLLCGIVGLWGLPRCLMYTFVFAAVEQVEYVFRPTAGACLVFDSDAVHDGGVLVNGTKYILRSEVMFAGCTRGLT